MSIAPEFAYAQARIQARLATLPADSEWERLAASRTLASFLEEARAGSLRGWVKGFSGQSDAHDLEAGLRLLYREMLETIAGWVPSSWRESVSWIQWLALLPVLAHLQSGGSAPAWVARDRSLCSLLGDRGEYKLGIPSNARVLRLLGDRTQAVSVASWAEEWRRCWPPCNRSTALDLASLEVLLMNHAEAFRRVAPTSAWRLRQELRERLHLRFHRSTLQPAVPFIFLALTALDLERLRAALVSRALFVAREEAAAATVVRESA